MVAANARWAWLLVLTLWCLPDIARAMDCLETLELDLASLPDELREPLEFTCTDPAQLINQAFSKRSDGDDEAANRLYGMAAAALAKAPDDETYLRLHIEWMEFGIDKGDAAEEAEHFRLAMERCPSVEGEACAAVHGARGLRLLRVGNKQAARDSFVAQIELLDKLRAASPAETPSGSYFLTAMSLAQTGDTRRAGEICDRQLFPTQAVWRKLQAEVSGSETGLFGTFMLACAGLMQDTGADRARILAMLEDALAITDQQSLDAGELQSYLGIAQNMATLGRIGEADRIMVKALRRAEAQSGVEEREKPLVLRARLNYGLMLMSALGDSQRGQALLRSIYAASGDDEDAALSAATLLSDYYARHGRNRQALEWLRVLTQSMEKNEAAARVLDDPEVREQIDAATTCRLAGLRYMTEIEQRRYGEAARVFPRERMLTCAALDEGARARLLSLFSWHLGNAALYDKPGNTNPAQMEQQTLQAISVQPLGNELAGIQALVVLGRSQARLGSNGAGIALLKRAVESVRNASRMAATSSKQLMSTFSASYGDAYRELADLLLAENRVSEAQQAMALLKQWELSGQQEGAATAATGSLQPSATESQWLGRYESLATALSARGREAADLEMVSARHLRPAQRARLQALQAEVASRQQEMMALLASMRGAMPSLPLPRPAARKPEPAALSSEQSLAALFANHPLARKKDGEASLQYLVTERHARVLLSLPGNEVEHHRIDVPRAELEELLRDFRATLSSPSQNPQPLARRLHDLLLAPVRPALDGAGVTRVQLSLDGSLRYIPFAALHDGKDYVVRRYAFASGERAGPGRAEEGAAAWRVAGFGVSEGAIGFSSLPAVRRELDDVVQDAARSGDRGIYPGILRMDAEFTEQALGDALNGGYNAIHIASHFAFRPGSDLQSFLLLGDGRKLSIAQLRDSSFSFRNVDFLALSACETAMDLPDADGREVEGLSAALQKKGVRSVMATLWPVDDMSTALLMKSFYQAHQRKAGSKAQGLREAQLGFLDNKAAAELQAEVSRGLARSKAAITPAGLSHPYFWAPFIMMGASQ